MAWAAVRSLAVVLLLLIRCWLLLPVWDFVIVLCVGMHYFVSILVFAIILMEKREFVFLVPRDFCMALPRGVTGLPSVCDCGIS